MSRKPKGQLRKGWTTGACATAASKAAFIALVSGEFPDAVQITLPRGQTPSFSLHSTRFEYSDHDGSVVTSAIVAIEKDAGDDPDVTHGALIVAKVTRGSVGSGIRFVAGTGVGTVTKPGLPLPPGEPAINPVPRQMMCAAITQTASEYRTNPDVEIEITVPTGERLAMQTWNPRLGIVGGISILGTTGIVVPYSCSAWIHSIHRGIDVARATGHEHVAGCTGSTSEKAVQRLYGLADEDMLDMGDFVGGLLKYLRKNPVPKLTIGGGFGKLTKLAMGQMDLHSKRSQVDFNWLANEVVKVGGSETIFRHCQNANTANEVLVDCIAQQLPIANAMAELARKHALTALAGETEVDVVIIDRQGNIVGRSGE